MFATPTVATTAAAAALVLLLLQRIQVSQRTFKRHSRWKSETIEDGYVHLKPCCQSLTAFNGSNPLFVSLSSVS